MTTLWNVRCGGRNKLFPADTPDKAVKQFEEWAKDYPPLTGDDGKVIKPVAARVRDLGESEPPDKPSPPPAPRAPPAADPSAATASRPKEVPSVNPKPKGGKPK